MAGAKGFEPSIFSVTGRRVNRATPRAHQIGELNFASSGRFRQHPPGWPAAGAAAEFGVRKTPRYLRAGPFLVCTFGLTRSGVIMAWPLNWCKTRILA